MIVVWYSAVEFSKATGPPASFCLSVIVGGEVCTDLFPGLAEISRLENDVPAEIERVLVMRRQQDRRVPVKAKLLTRAQRPRRCHAPRD